MDARPTDVSDADAVRALVEPTVASFGRLPPGGQQRGPRTGRRLPGRREPPVEAFDSAITITLRSGFLSMEFEMAAMLDREDGGAIVSMASTAGLEAIRGLAGYVGQARRGVVQDVGPLGVRAGHWAYAEPAPHTTSKLVR